jgi:hypothetical protein
VLADDRLNAEGLSAIGELEAGEVTGPVRVNGGLAIFKLQRVEATLSNSEEPVVEFMSDEARAEARARWVARLRRQRKVVVDTAPILRMATQSAPAMPASCVRQSR